VSSGVHLKRVFFTHTTCVSIFLALQQLLLFHQSVRNVIEEVIQKLVRVLLGEAAEQLYTRMGGVQSPKRNGAMWKGPLAIFLPQLGNELPGGHNSGFLLLGGDSLVELRKTCENGLLGFHRAVLLDAVPEGLAKIERLQHRVTIAGISELAKKKRREEKRREEKEEMALKAHHMKKRKKKKEKSIRSQSHNISRHPQPAGPDGN